MKERNEKIETKGHRKTENQNPCEKENREEQVMER